MIDNAIHGAWAKLPGFGGVARGYYLRRFRRAYAASNLYWGIFGDFASAQAEADRLSTAQLPSTYDLDAAGRMYRSHLDGIRVSDYPLVHWLDRLFARGARSVFDLGGNIGVSYYAFSRYVDYPDDLAWTVHDMPKVMAIGRTWAQTHDDSRRLAFADAETGADGQDVLLVTGALQYLPYTLPELLRRLSAPPERILVNLSPMHETREFFTLQNLGIAICPYRITSAKGLVDELQALGYSVLDRWISHERHLDVPFHPEARIDGYSGFVFSREAG